MLTGHAALIIRSRCGFENPVTHMWAASGARSDILGKSIDDRTHPRGSFGSARYLQTARTSQKVDRFVMTTNLDSFEPATDATKMTEIYVRAVNAGNADAVNRLYAQDAVSIWEPGMPISGQARRDSVIELIARKPSMKAAIRESYVTGDTALLVVDWSIDVTTEEGGPEHLAGVGLDVLRRGADGKWRYVIDNPFGEA